VGFFLEKPLNLGLSKIVPYPFKIFNLKSKRLVGHEATEPGPNRNPEKALFRTEEA
jgi:hypothetical protein